MTASMLQHRPIAPAAPQQTRGHSLLLRDLHGLESAVLAAVDAKASADLDAERKQVLIRHFRLACRHNDRYVNRAEFALAIGKFSLGAAPRAGTHKANRHHVVPRPDNPSYDVNHDLVDQLFARDSEASGAGGERLVGMPRCRSRRQAGCGQAVRMRTVAEATRSERQRRSIFAMRG